MRRCLPLSLFVATALGSTAGCGAWAPEAPDVQPSPGGDVAKPEPLPTVVDTSGYVGTVAAVGADWVELGPGWEGESINGKKRWDEKDSQKPKRVSAARTLAGGDPNGLYRHMTYPLTALKVGDKVDINTGLTRDGGEFCLEITILRRPGGKIPREPWLVFADSGVEGHYRNQAYQDWEEKGVPIPKRFLSNGRAPWTNPPYPPEAPMPRPAVRAKP